MRSADGSPAGVSALEPLIRAHIKALYDFLRSVYPAADTDEQIATTFESVTRADLDALRPHARLWLFARARQHVVQLAPPDWMSRNLQQVRAQLNDQAKHLNNHSTRAEVTRLACALGALSDDDQEILLLAAALGRDAGDDLAIVLRSPTERTAARLAGARAAINHAYASGRQPQAQAEGDRP